MNIKRSIFRAVLSLAFAALILTGCSANADASPRETQTPGGHAEQAAAETPSADPQPSEDASDEPSHVQKIMLGDFTAQTLDGSEFTQQNIADYDLTIINFWGTSCPPCINEMPDIAELEQKLANENSNVALITYCLDGAYSPETCAAILENSGYTGITLVSSDGVLGDLADSVMYIPTTVFVYGDGEAALSLVGGQTDIEGEYMSRADALLKARDEQ